ncbi:MAG: dTMP kinase [Verrucomicrobiae bacterium]|nr:dTMP kinase [Verrucomicrobiae bacterium]
MNNKHEYPGRLIAVEGLDGSGKSTQVYLLKRWLEVQGVKVFFTEWNSSVLVREATRKGKKRQLLTPTTFSLVHATDFADRYERQILPLMRAGFIVLADRYIYTAFARDIVRGCDPRWVRNLYSFAVAPDITFFFDTPLEVALGRILSGRPKLKYFEAGMDLKLADNEYESFKIFQGRIYDEYKKMVQTEAFVVMDGMLPVEKQQAMVRKYVEQHIDLPAFRWRGRP